MGDPDISITFANAAGDHVTQCTSSRIATGTDLKKQLQELISIPEEQQRLLVGELPLNDNATLAAQGIADDTVLTFVRTPSR